MNKNPNRQAQENKDPSSKEFVPAADLPSHIGVTGTGDPHADQNSDAEIEEKQTMSND